MKSFQKDEIIEIARVLLMPEESMIDVGLIDQYVWWKESDDNSTDIPPKEKEVCEAANDGTVLL